LEHDWSSYKKIKFMETVMENSKMGSIKKMHDAAVSNLEA
jgi:hypothetical protein